MQFVQKMYIAVFRGNRSLHDLGWLTNDVAKDTRGVFLLCRIRGYSLGTRTFPVGDFAG